MNKAQISYNKELSTVSKFIILDADIKVQAQNYISKNSISNNIPLNFLPIESLEKYFKAKLFDNVDHKLFRYLNDFVFHQTSLNQITDEYRSSNEHIHDNNGKKLYERIDKELRARKKSRTEIIEMVVDYLNLNNQESLEKVTNFLKTQLQ